MVDSAETDRACCLLRLNASWEQAHACDGRRRVPRLLLRCIPGRAVHSSTSGCCCRDLIRVLRAQGRPHIADHAFRCLPLLAAFCFLVGIVLVFVKYPFFGMLIETFGFLNLFG